jgi:hypothetical protein
VGVVVGRSPVLVLVTGEEQRTRQAFVHVGSSYGEAAAGQTSKAY